MKCWPAPRSDDDAQRVVGGDFGRVRDERVDHREVERC